MHYINKLEKLLCVVSISAIVIFVLSQIFMRYVTGNSLAWSEELTSWFFLWMAWLGISANFVKNEHISVGGITYLFEKRGYQVFLRLLVSVGSCLFLGMLAYITFKTMMKPFIWRQSSVVLGLPVYILYMSVLVGCLLSILRLVFNEIQNLKTDKQ